MPSALTADELAGLMPADPRHESLVDGLDAPLIFGATGATDSTIRATAAAFAEPTLRSLDAIHLATAQVLTNESGTELLAFVTYDRRLLDAAKATGLPTASPGQN